MKKILSLLISSTLIISSIFSQGVREEKVLPTYTASTAWTAAFAQLGGLDDITNIAPANLNHPPEYEILPQDINNIVHSKLFIYAGYEGMMKTLSKNLIDESKMIKINTSNSLDNVIAVASQISKQAGTEEISKVRVSKYKTLMIDARKYIKANNLDQLRCLVNFHQAPLAKDLGLNVVKTFGPGAITPADIKDASVNNYDLIIDNVHTILSGPLVEVSPDTPIIIWRNFPDNLEPDALYNMVDSNIKLLEELK
ncbi:MAG: ABC transporter substrate-binding protein [Spirochaetaceae bacterium]|nr:ABC transporter substrate-binding protein [Spirochaetaceae bacterium]